MMKMLRTPWEGILTPRERFNRQMHFRPVDRCFNMEFGYWDEVFDQWPMFRDNGIPNTPTANHALGFDPMENICPPWYMHPFFEEKMVEDKGDTQIFINMDGVLYELPADGHSTIPKYLHSSIENEDDWKRVKEERFRRDDPARKVDIASLKKAFPDDRTFPVGVYCGSMIGNIRDILTLEGLCYAMYDYPEMVEDMVETSCLLVEDFLDQVLPEIQVDFASGWEDICFKNGPIVSVGFFRDVLLPRYKRIKEKLAQYGVDVWYTDCDGDVRPLLPYFLEGGINCLFPFEINACGHPGELLDQYPDLRIMGGVDKMQLIAGKKEIEQYMLSLVPYVERGGFIPFCDHLCPPDVSQENYEYYLDLKKELFGQVKPVK